ncbi:MAG: hypothetical protein K9G70_06115 [Prolixibacteraceae bacterium]|nr:hypothetical protein [Prolixibacteraceae bacterium]
MKTNTKRSRNIILTFIMVLMVSAFSSCATRAVFLSSAVVPAAKGTVTVKEDDNNNYRIKVDIKNLAASQSLTPPKNAYVLWLLTENNASKNIGQIISSTGSMSSKLKASFETVSPEKPSKIFITAEKEADIQSPDSAVVLTTDYIK